MSATKRPPDLLHNMSVPPTSRITVQRAALPGKRFRVDFSRYLSARAGAGLAATLAKHGWRTAWTLLGRTGEPPEGPRGRRTRERLEEHLADALRRSEVPERVGVFLVEPEGAAPASTLGPAAALAALARRSGSLYLPTRALDPSLADPRPLVLFFPEETR